MKQFILSILIFLEILLSVSQAQERQISLNGEWRFMLDFVNKGLSKGWQSETYSQESGWDKVQVPHSFSADGRYLFYEGTAWYRKQFTLDNKPLGSRVLLRFDAVFNRSSVWLNGTRIGTHEGGYTPFELDVTDYIVAGKNFLAVQVNNQLDSLTIPTILGGAGNSGVVGWINYGGITRAVTLLVKPDIYIQKVKVEAVPDLKKGNATVSIRTFLVNTRNAGSVINIGVNLFREGKLITSGRYTTKADVGGNSDGSAIAIIALNAAKTTLWSVDRPVLYNAEIIAGADTQRVNFGIRKIEVKGNQLLVNGESVKYGGANLVLDYPKLGSVVNDTVVDRYMRRMKEGGMELQRITHYPLPEAMLNWADKNGMLIIAEAGNWGYGDGEMTNPALRTVYKKQLKEMIEADWNHPSVIAYSVGNEYASYSEAGINWTRDMFNYIKTIDTSRLNTFVSDKIDESYVVKPEGEASFYCDFVCANIYSNAQRLEEIVNKIQRFYPDKPLIISEWGMRNDYGRSEQERTAYIQDVIAILRKSKNVIGSVWWSFNDYYSRHSGSNQNGMRGWGLVDHQLQPRDAYRAYQAELSPVILTKKAYKENKLTIQLSARNDFPRHNITGYQLKYSGGIIPVPALLPGQQCELQLNISHHFDNETIKVFKPTGFETYQTTLQLN